MIKIIHTADIHLDSPLSSQTAENAALRRQELRSAFTNMLLYARLNEVDLLLMAGDVVDSKYATRETASLLAKEFAAMPKVRIVIAPGNHDPYAPGSVWSSAAFPSNVYIFDRPELSYFAFDDIGCDVYGYAFTSRTMTQCPFASKRAVRPERINLLCGHGDMTAANSAVCPITRADLEQSGFDYAALGHIHNSGGIQTAGRTYYGYSGCLEGRDFGECGCKGAIYAEIDRGPDGAVTVSARGLRFSRRHYESLTLDVTGCRTAEEAAAKYAEAVKAVPAESGRILRVILVGSVTPDFTPGTLAKDESITLVDRTVPTFDTDALRADPGIRGTFYRSLLPMLESGDPGKRETAAEALRLGLSAL